ncbi:helix-turn-helix transcriptional regulator [Paenibacillaceae bacterium WGS1546]|uniref:helix-turn-helix transcriptional regulator n=1 Tax=Cohnella sp. WGS1546 TaxID=3366810 RepID=UPI00372D87BB
MKSWSEKKKELKSIDPDRLNELEAVAQLVNAIHQRRIELGWTQQELATRVGFHRKSIARIENGGTVPRLDTVMKLVFALGMKIRPIIGDNQDVCSQAKAARRRIHDCISSN